MNLTQTAQLLTIASGFDRFIEVGQVNTTAWHAALAEVDAQAATNAVIAFYSSSWDGKQQLSPATILDACRARTDLAAIETDVRSAKARKMIGADWPKDEPLPADVAQRLAEIRDADRAAARIHLAEIEAA